MRNGDKTSGKKIMADGTAIPPEVKRLMGITYATTAFDNLQQTIGFLIGLCNKLAIWPKNIAIGRIKKQGKTIQSSMAILIAVMIHGVRRQADG
jgi:hypothetical protein